MPDPTAGSGKPSTSEPGAEQQPSGKPDTQKAGEALKKAGQQVARAGSELPEMPVMRGPGGEGEWDPLMPDTNQASGSSSDIFSDSAEQASSSSEADDMMMPEENSASSSGHPDDMMMSEEQTSSGSDGSGIPDDLAADILAAKEALEQAGVTLERAGEMLDDAETSADLAEAEAELARARVAVIVAGQDLLDLKDIFEGTEHELLIEETGETLDAANVAIVIATESIFSTRIDLPEFERQQAQGGGSGNGEASELEKELNDSIIVFENRILEARAGVIGSAPPPTSGENIPGVAVLGGTGDSDEGTFEENTDEEPLMGDQTVTQQGRMPEGGEVAAVEPEQGSLIPEDVPDPQGDDIVAQQLREAAIAETDPDLRDKLWEEYKRYKAGL